jgi:hypothetical protein
LSKPVKTVASEDEAALDVTFDAATASLRTTFLSHRQADVQAARALLARADNAAWAALTQLGHRLAGVGCMGMTKSANGGENWNTPRKQTTMRRAPNG